MEFVIDEEHADLIPLEHMVDKPYTIIVTHCGHNPDALARMLVKGYKYGIIEDVISNRPTIFDSIFVDDVSKIVVKLEFDTTDDTYYKGLADGVLLSEDFPLFEAYLDDVRIVDTLIRCDKVEKVYIEPYKHNGKKKFGYRPKRVRYIEGIHHPKRVRYIEGIHHVYIQEMEKITEYIASLEHKKNISSIEINGPLMGRCYMLPMKHCISAEHANRRLLNTLSRVLIHNNHITSFSTNTIGTEMLDIKTPIVDEILMAIAGGKTGIAHLTIDYYPHHKFLQNVIYDIMKLDQLESLRIGEFRGHTQFWEPRHMELLKGIRVLAKLGGITTDMNEHINDALKYNESLVKIISNYHNTELDGYELKVNQDECWTSYKHKYVGKRIPIMLYLLMEEAIDDLWLPRDTIEQDILPYIHSNARPPVYTYVGTRQAGMAWRMMDLGERYGYYSPLSLI